ncbi:endo alpha-1,4 polygalactosaminidase (plasmid) [Embleya sp. NBC_00888]|nr:endo alpha-1,4 polygalactosaminidase [Embleya sp. NBC_00888]
MSGSFIFRGHRGPRGHSGRHGVAGAAVALTLALAAVAGCGSEGGSDADANPPRAAAGSPSAASTAASPTAPVSATAPEVPTRSASPTAPGAAPAPNSPAPPGQAAPGTSAKQVVPPAADAPFDYQIGGPYPPPANVRVVIRDRGARPEPGRYNICYVNAFQTQPDARAWWEKEHPDLLLRKAGKVVLDEDWGEALLDVSTEAKRAKLIAVVGPWIDDCAKSGFQAVEPDNLDSYSRSGGLLTLEHDAAFARLLTGRAHAAGLAIGQKNTVELAGRRAEIGFDFAVAEECGHYDECGAYASAFANRVFVVEYTRADFDTACRGWGGKVSVVLRDRQVTAPGNSAHVYASC